MPPLPLSAPLESWGRTTGPKRNRWQLLAYPLLRCAYCDETLCATCAITRAGHTVCPGHTTEELDDFVGFLARTGS